MPHKAFVRDIVAITREIELPDECPECGAEFSPGSKNVKCWHLRPSFDSVRLTKVLACGVETDVVETLPTTQISQNEPWIRLPAIFKCAKCHFTLARQLTRTYDLQAMDLAMVHKLRDLLYDSNVKDDAVRAKVWGNKP